MRLEDIYPKSITPFEELLEEAEDQMSGDYQEAFVKDIRHKYNQYGSRMFMSSKQHDFLCAIALGDAEEDTFDRFNR